MSDVLQLTAKSAAVIEILRGTGAKMFAHEIADANPSLFEKGAKSVSPLMTRLVANGFADKEKASVTVVNAEGNEVTKELTRYWLTPAGESVVFEIKAA
jgi:hypothetical protein